MRSKRILRIIALLLPDEPDPSLQRIMFFLKLLYKSRHFIGQLLVNLPAFITDLAVLQIFPVFILGLHQLLQLIRRFVQQLMQALNDLFTDFFSAMTSGLTTTV